MDVIQSASDETDINDVFDTIAFSEERISKKAYEEGLEKGKEDGKIDGYHLGFHKGFEFGFEIGFYKELTKVLIDDFKLKDSKSNEKINFLLTKLNTLLDQFPTEINEDIDVLNEINSIRAYYKKINSLLKLNISFPASFDKSF